MTTTKATRSPIWWVPTGFFSMGIAYVMLTGVSATMFKNLGMSIGDATFYASWLILAYTIKPLFSPIVEMYRTKKFFVLLCQFVIAGGFAAAGLVMSLENFLPILIGLFFLISFFGSMQDISTEGVFITSLNAKQQSLFTGVSSLSWNIAYIVGSGLLVSLAGYLYTHVYGHPNSDPSLEWVQAWRIIFFIVAGGCFLIPLWHLRFMPSGAKAENTPKNMKEGFGILADSFVTFFHKKDIVMMIAFLFLFQTSIGFLDKIGPLFMLDSVANGGLGLSNQDQGLIYGTFGTAAGLVGALLGGVVVARYGVKATLLPLCAAVNIPNVTFLLLSIYQPSNFYLIAAAVVGEKFFLGFGMIAFVVYMFQQVAPGKYVTSHYAFATSIKGLTMMLAGMFSGKLQEMMGYNHFFIFVMIATIPSFYVSWKAPFNVAPPEHVEEE
jgi:MFS transporter, PAT family, beta-lactamase induction signal transducer AmpG